MIFKENYLMSETKPQHLFIIRNHQEQPVSGQTITSNSSPEGMPMNLSRVPVMGNVVSKQDGESFILNRFLRKQ